MTNPTNEREAERAAIVAFMRDVIERGYPAWHEINGMCAHGTYEHEDCVGCYDEHLLGALNYIERGDHIPQNQSLDHLQPSKGE